MDQKRSCPLECLDAMRFRPCKTKSFLNSMGTCYEPDPSIGEGYYWFYDQPGMFTVAQMDLRIYHDYIMEYQQPDFLSINYYDTISAEELSPYKRLSAHCIRGYVSKGELFRLRCHKNIPVRGLELMLMPGYYRDYLNQRYPGAFPDPRAAFRSIDGCTDFPELVLVLKQISNFKGVGGSARLYYESKVSEVLSLIVERSKNQSLHPSEKPVYRPDLGQLEAARIFIEEHFAEEIRTEQLALIACMGQSKLRASFKMTYGTTITEYLQNRRMASAETLLEKTDFSIAQVAEAVGYHHGGRFSALFRKYTGMAPETYRKMMR